MSVYPWWTKYPYQNDEVLNLDWLLTQVTENTEDISDFINLNTIKYADPIEWDITSQYEANTIVVDPQSGDAYISTTAVPYGVALSNTDYWTIIYNYSDTINNLQEQIAIANEELSTTATEARSIGDLVWLNGELYEVTAAMIAGDSYVENSNCIKTTIEEYITTRDATINATIEALDEKVGELSDLTTTDQDSIVDAINELVTSDATIDAKVGALSDLNTTDKDSVVDAINELVTSDATIDAKVGELSDLNTTDQDSVVDAINEVIDSIPGYADFITPEQFGAVGDGVTDDTQALIDCFGSDDTQTKYILMNGTYLVTAQITVQSNTVVKGNGVIYDNFDTTNTSTLAERGTLLLNGISNVYIHGITLQGTGALTAYTTKYFVLGLDSENIVISHCKMLDYPGVSITYMMNCNYVVTEHCYISEYTRAALTHGEGTSHVYVFNNVVLNGRETNSANRYPIMLCGYYNSYDSDNTAPQAYYLYCCNNYIEDDTPWWEGIDAHGGQYIYVLNNQIYGVACGIAVFTNAAKGFSVRYAYIQNNVVQSSTTTTTNAAPNGSSFGGQDMDISNNIFRYGGQAYTVSGGSAGVYFNYGVNVNFHHNQVVYCVENCLYFSGTFSAFNIYDNYLTAPSGGYCVSFRQTTDVLLYTCYVSRNTFVGSGTIIRAPYQKSTTNQMLKLFDNNYSLLAPSYENIDYVKPDKATATQIASSTCGENGDICWNYEPAVGSPIGWIMTDATHGTGTWVAMPDLS